MRNLFKLIFIAAVLSSVPLFIVFQLEYNIFDLTTGSEDDAYITLMGINATGGYRQRKNTYLKGCRTSEAFHAQAGRAYLGLSIKEDVVEESFKEINDYEDTSDFNMNTLLRLMYFNQKKNVLSTYLRTQLEDTIINFKYWFTEPNEDDMIFWTENHEILFLTAELLAGQLYPKETFSNSGMNGTAHVTHALRLINKWINWRAQFGFSEWHSNIYYTLDVVALVNLVDFAKDTTVATKAAMLLDLIAFDFANNYYQGLYATTHGRTEDNKVVGRSVERPTSRESTTEVAWIVLGIGEHNIVDASNIAAVALATSDKYVPPPILESIAKHASSNNEHKERMSINIADGPENGFGYNSEDDLTFWWPMSAPAAAQIIDASLKLIDKYDIKYELVYNEEIFIDILRIASSLHGISLSEYCNLLADVTQGVCLETVNTYTYRTPNYQLSGAQDHQKGMNGLQEHIWQASLDANAIVYTSMPGGISPQEFTGGWKPRATLYKNIGIIQYDRKMLPLDGELIALVLGFTPYNHAYFPRWAFDDVISQGKWTFGVKDDGYIALYSYEPTSWQSNYELQALGKKNVWIVELGSADEYDSFEQFVSTILQAKVEISDLSLGYSVNYESPSQGKVNVDWNGAMFVKGKAIDLGPYARFDNDYCYQEFGTNKTTIKYGSEQLVLDFDTGTRNYVS